MDSKKEIEQLRDQLTEFIPYDDGKEIRKQIRDWAILNYKQKYSDNHHMDFAKRNMISTEVVHPQSTNHPYYYQMFSVVTQHIYADTIEELYDNAIDIEKENEIKKQEQKEKDDKYWDKTFKEAEQELKKEGIEVTMTTRFQRGMDIWSKHIEESFKT
ncbi:MAG: hypothetical protein ACE1ZQ_02810 [Ignavibacteriaceae bacterium]